MTSLKTEFDTRGFAVVRGLLSAAEVRETNENVGRFVRDVMPGLAEKHAHFHDVNRPESLRQLHRLNVDLYFDTLRRRSDLQLIVETVLQEAADVEQLQWFDKPPGYEHPTPPHQDNHYFCLTPPNVAVVWMALDAVDEENGCLRYLPGSHLERLREHRSGTVLGFSQCIVDYSDADRSREIAVKLAPGDVIVHHGNVVHRADSNRSPTRHRRGLATVFRGVSCRRDEAAFARYEQSLRSQRLSLGVTT